MRVKEATSAFKRCKKSCTVERIVGNLPHQVQETHNGGGHLYLLYCQTNASIDPHQLTNRDQRNQSRHQVIIIKQPPPLQDRAHMPFPPTGQDFLVSVSPSNRTKAQAPISIPFYRTRLPQNTTHQPPPPKLRPQELTHLSGDICKLYVLLQMTHHHEVPGLGPVVVQCVMVDMAQDGTNTDPGAAQERPQQ